MTHGFDSQGRRYDADGAVRDWWMPSDEKKFKAQTAKLVLQANAYQQSLVPTVTNDRIGR